MIFHTYSRKKNKLFIDFEIAISQGSLEKIFAKLVFHA